MKNRKYQINTEENREFLEMQRRDLMEFGRRFPSPGGSAYYLGADGTPWKQYPRETWITSRMAHSYSLCSMLGDRESRNLAQAAIRGLRGELKDREHGGWFPGIHEDGTAMEGKQCYAHAFVILAASSALLAQCEGAGELLSDAAAEFDRYFWDESEGMVFDTWDSAFLNPENYRGINASMHSVEAFLALADALENENVTAIDAGKYRARAGRIIDRVIRWAQENNWRIPEHYTADWQPDLEYNTDKPDDPFKPYGATPGHGIEWARLILQHVISEKGADISAAQNLYRRAAEDGWNCDGAPGFVYTTGWDGKPVVHDRMHWTLAEAINTASALYRTTTDQAYADDYYMYMEYLDRFVLDHEKGSWIHQLDRENRAAQTVWPGKPDIYHALQASLIPLNTEPGVSIATAVKRKMIR